MAEGGPIKWLPKIPAQTLMEKRRWCACVLTCTHTCWLWGLKHHLCEGTFINEKYRCWKIWRHRILQEGRRLQSRWRGQPAADSAWTLWTWYDNNILPFSTRYVVECNAPRIRPTACMLMFCWSPNISSNQSSTIAVLDIFVVPASTREARKDPISHSCWCKHANVFGMGNYLWGNYPRTVVLPLCYCCLQLRSCNTYRHFLFSKFSHSLIHYNSVYRLRTGTDSQV